MPSTPDTAPAKDKLDPAVVKPALVIMGGGLAVVFDSTIVNVALNDLSEELDASISTIQWVSTAYLLAMFVAIPATGWLQARLGGKRLWILAQAAFLLGSILCAMSWNAGSLIGFRALQGLAGGIMTPLMITLVMQLARGQSFGRLMAVAGLPSALGPILGPVIGGLILGSLTWHWLFLVNIPVCLLGIFLAWRVLAADSPAVPSERKPFDLVGFALLSPGVVGIIYGLSQIGAHGGVGYPDVWIPGLVGIALVAAFVLWAISRRENALVDVVLLKHRPLALSSFLLGLTGIALYGMSFLLPLYFQALRGETALTSGMLLIPQGIGMLLSRSLGGSLTDSIGAKPVAIIGFSVVTLGTIPFAFTTDDSLYWWLMVALFIRGIGIGFVMTPLMTVAYIGIDPDKMPDASIITRITQQLGGSFGTALLAMILTASIVDMADPVSISAGFDTAFWWAAGLTLLGGLMAFLLPSRKLS